MKIYSGLFPIFNPLNAFYPEAETVKVKPGYKFEEHGILILHGGSDIHPSIYNRPNQGSYVGEFPSRRDQDEMKLFADAVNAGIPILGICRGAQLACAMVGGILVQDVDGHKWGSHRIITKDEKNILASTIHHQMMYPWKVEHELLGWSAIPRATHYAGISDEELAEWPTKVYDGPEAKEGVVEPEIVWFPQVKCLAVQGHPEMMSSDCAFNQHLKELLDVRCLSS